MGHRISGEGRTPTQSYTERIGKFPVPKSVTELQRFLDTVGYYRCYIPNLATIASPLYNLTKKGTPFNWDQECDAAFNVVRQYLVQEQVTLKYPEWEKPFYIEADASALGVAAVLSQMDERTRVLRPSHSTGVSPKELQRRPVGGVGVGIRRTEMVSLSKGSPRGGVSDGS